MVIYDYDDPHQDLYDVDDGKLAVCPSYSGMALNDTYQRLLLSRFPIGIILPHTYSCQVQCKSVKCDNLNRAHIHDSPPNTTLINSLGRPDGSDLPVTIIEVDPTKR